MVWYGLVGVVGGTRGALVLAFSGRREWCSTWSTLDYRNYFMRPSSLGCEGSWWANGIKVIHWGFGCDYVTLLWSLWRILDTRSYHFTI